MSRLKTAAIIIGTILALVVCLFSWAIVTFLHNLSSSQAAPNPCANTLAHPPPLALQDELFVSAGGLAPPSRNGRMTLNSAICVVRASDGAVLKRYLFPHDIITGLAESDGLLHVIKNRSNLCVMRADNGAMLWCQTPLIRQLPLVSNGVLYAIAYVQEKTEYVAEVAAFGASDGKAIWQYPLQPDPIFLQIAVANGFVYILNQNSQRTTDLCALQASDGTMRWGHPFGGLIPLALAADATGAYAFIGDVSAQPEQDQIVALRSADGAVAWQQTARGYLSSSPVASPPLVQDGILYVPGSTSETGGSTSGMLDAFRASDGTLLRQFDTIGLPHLAITSGVLYLADSDGLRTFQASTGAPLWNNGMRGNLLLGSGVLYLFEGNNVSALRASDGELLWKDTDCAQGATTTRQGPLNDNGVVSWCNWNSGSGTITLALATSAGSLTISN